MGANQSQPQHPNEKLVIERLRELQMRDQEGQEQEHSDGFVHVDEKTTSSHFRAPWTSLSSSELEDWEHTLLQDPKNRWVVAVASLL
jgi:bleomycin hydrolase